MGAPRKTIAIGRHDSNFNFLSDCKRKNKRIRIGSRNPNELVWVNYNIISTNSDILLFDSREFKPIDFFEFAKANSLKNIMVLTRKEHDYIFELSIDFDIKIRIFEECFPFFDEIRYVSNLRDNINEAKKLLNECKSLNLNGGSAFRYISTLFQYKQERKIRYKSELDNIVYFSCLPPYQEVFKAKESRKDRLVLALDFNAMFSDCLLGSFPNPKSLRFSKFNHDDYYNKQLDDGFYRAKLINARNTFFLKNHPFRYSKSNKSYNFNLSEGDSIEVFLPKEEIDYYSKFFSTVEIIEGIYSESQIKHPLSDIAKNIFKERKSFPSESPRSKLAKLKANIISSLGNPKRFKEYYCKNKSDIISKTEELLSIEFDSKLSLEQKLELAKSSNRVQICDDGTENLKFKIFDTRNHESIYTLYSKMISNSRIKMIKLIEKLYKIDSLELCYANVDSVHISINKNDLDSLYNLLSSEISDNIGGLKVEAVASSAYWFELGRYWLLNARNIVKYSNYLFNHAHSKEPITTRRRIKKAASLYGYRYVKSFNMSIYKTFSFKKLLKPINNIDNISYERYGLEDVLSASVASTSVSKEKVRSHSLKSSLLQELATVECSSNITHKL
jgi:hypothetical protein